MHINVFVKVGRNPAHCVASCADEVAAANAEAHELAKQVASGVAPERVKFERVTVGKNAKKGKQ